MYIFETTEMNPPIVARTRERRNEPTCLQEPRLAFAEMTIT